MNLTLASIAISFFCSILLFVIKSKSPVWLHKGTPYPLGRFVVVLWGISFLLLGRYFHQTALPLSAFFSTLFLVLGVQVTLWAIGISLQILGNVPGAPETLPESSFRHRPSDSGWSAKPELTAIETIEEDAVTTMKPRSGYPGRSWSGTIERVVSILASLATAAAIFVLIYQIGLSNRIESRRVAVEAIRQTRSSEFMKSLRQMKKAYQTKRVDEKDTDSLIDSVNYVMNVYDDIAVVYINDLADRCVIKDAIDPSVREAVTMRDSLASSSPEDKKHLDLFLTLMSHESCEGRHLTPPK